MKTIEQLIKLSKNPHYQLTDEETKALEQWRESQSFQNKDKKRNNPEFKKDTGNFKKHDTKIEQE